MRARQRVDAVLTGQPVDRPPTSVWGHDFLREWSAEDLAAQTIETQRRYGYDFVKINPRWTLFAEPWGNRYVKPTEQRFPRLTHRIVMNADDLSDIPAVSADHPVLQEHVNAVRAITAELGDETPCLATLFSPLACLGLMAGGVGRPLLDFLHSAPGAAHDALEHITATLRAHAIELLNAGAVGLFFAPLQWTSTEVCTPEVYATFGERYDRQVLAAAQEAPFNMLHVCGNHIAIERIYDYPVQVLNWDNFGEGNPELAEVAAACDKIVAGGIPHRKLHKLSADALYATVEEALGDLRGNIMLAGGCGIGALTPPEPRQAVVVVADHLA